MSARRSRPIPMSLDERETLLRELLSPSRGWPVYAREYRRVSVDESGEEKSIKDQGVDNGRLADRYVWGMRDPYEDVGSASDFADKQRDDYEDLIADLQADRFNAHILIVWSPSRGSRQVGEWLLLLELCRERGVFIYVTSRRRLIDPCNHYDLHYMINEANTAQLYSAELSDSIRRNMNTNAQAGGVHGPIGFGFQRVEVPDPEHPKRAVRVQTHEPRESELIKELFDRLDGRGDYARSKVETLSAITRDWAARGVVNARGRPFRRERMRVLALTHAYAGLRVHQSGRRKGDAPDLSRAVIYRGNWEPIVPEDKFWRVYARLTDPTRLTHKGGSATHLLTFIAVCDKCSSGLGPRHRDNPRMQCPRGCVSVSEPELDAVVVEAVLGWLSEPEIRKRLLADHGLGERAVAARVNVTKIEAELRKLRAQLKAGGIDADDFADAKPAIMERLEDARADARRWSSTSTLGPFLDPDADLRVRWDESELAIKRDVLRDVLTPTRLGQVRVLPAGRSKWVPVRDRLVWLVVD
jgi:site-specific DNA recombinase